MTVVEMVMGQLSCLLGYDRSESPEKVGFTLRLDEISGDPHVKILCLLWLTNIHS